MNKEGTRNQKISLGEKPKDGVTIGQPFPRGTGGSDNFRIPSIVRMRDGTLVASADARWNLEKDGGGLAVIVSRSTDSGATWHYSFAGHLEDHGKEWNPDASTLMDPLLLTDGETLYLFADLFPAGYSISSVSTSNTFSDLETGFDGKGNLLLSADGRKSYRYYLCDGKIYEENGVEGYRVDEWFHLYQNGTHISNLFFKNSPFQVHATSYICMMTSKDGGVSWSFPKLLNIKNKGTVWLVLGPGKGLVTKDGTLMFSAYDGKNVYLFFSKDKGETWGQVKTGEAKNESQLVELKDGTIRMFVKYADINKIQYIDFFRQGDTYCAGSLVNTGIDNFSNCMVSVTKYSKTLKGKEILLVSCPSESSGGTWGGRFHGKIYVFSLDDKNQMYLEDSYPIYEGFFAYSCMAEREDGSIDVLFEDDCISYPAGNYCGVCSHIKYINMKIPLFFDEI